MRLSREVISVLDRSTISGHQLVLPGQLDRKLYVAVNMALAALGGKWNRKAGAHVFDGDPSAEIEAAIASGEVENRKQVLGFFETPAPLAERLVEMAGIREGHSVLEPSAGRGAIAKFIASRHDKAYLTMVEIDAKHSPYLRCVNGPVYIEDFLRFDAGPHYDRIVANPPFAKQVDVDHVLHMHRRLKPGGWLVSVMAAGVTFRENRKSVDFRAFVDDQGGDIEPLPEGSFKESGTHVSTCVVRIPKVRAA